MFNNNESPLETILKLASQQAAAAASRRDKAPVTKQQTDVGARVAAGANHADNTGGANAEPKVVYDRYLHDDYYYFVVECAGVPKNKIKVTLVSEANVAYINVELEKRCDDRCNKIYGEIVWGTAKRAIQVPKDVDLTAIEALLEDGMLTIILKRLKGGGESVFKEIPIMSRNDCEPF